jgi:DNA end-binding protein Ku
LPGGKTGIEAFAVIREAMRNTGMVALGRLVMSTRERICALEVEEDALLMTRLRTAVEVRAIEDIEPPQLPKPDPRMLDIAQKIIEQQASDFDPSEFKDRYEDALRALIEERRKGMPVCPQVEPAADTKVVDLMDALKRGLRSKGGSGVEPTRWPRAASKSKVGGRGKRAA